MEHQSTTTSVLVATSCPAPSSNLEDAPSGPRPIQFVYENPSADSLEFEEPIRLYPCTVSGCKVTCKRPYELERHRQTVHNQSRHWFCPVDSCLLSCAIAGLAKIHLQPELKLIDYRLSRQRRPLTCKLRVSEDDGYANLELNGFKRKDKLTKHLKEAHKDDFFRLGGMTVGKEYSKDRPLICDVQLFWINPRSDTPESVFATSRTWHPSPLWRLQLDDDTWSAYLGLFPNAVAEAGFQCWTKQDDESFKRLGQDPKFVDVLPWQAHDLILKLGSDAPMPKRSAFEDFRIQLILHHHHQNKKRLMMARQEQDALSLQSHDPRLGIWTTETQHPSNGHGTTMTDDSAQPDCALESVPASCTENLQHSARVPALSLGFESTPGPYENTQIDTGTLPDVGVEADFVEFDWDALLSADLNSGSDSNYVALDNSENLEFRFSDPAFDSNLGGDLDDLAFNFNFNDPDSTPAWYLDVENVAKPGL